MKIFSILVFSIILASCGGGSQPATSDGNDGEDDISASIVKVGIYPGDKRIQAFEVETNLQLDHVLLFQPVSKIDYSKVIPFLDAGYDVILNIEFFDNYANLKDIASGKYDTNLLHLAESIKRDGRTIWLRPLHEFNGDWYNWGAFYGEGQDIKDFKAAWIHVVTFFREREVPVKFQFNYNRRNGKDMPNPFSDWWVGDEYVDMVVITSYNRAYTSEFHQYWRTFSEEFSPAYEQVVKLTGKPIGIAEMSSTSYGGDKPKWIDDAFKDIAQKYPRVEQVTWFLYNRPVGSTIWDWGINTQAERDAFSNGVLLLQKTER